MYPDIITLAERRGVEDARCGRMPVISYPKGSYEYNAYIVAYEWAKEVA